MPGHPVDSGIVACKTPGGHVLATVEIFAPPGSASRTVDAHPLLLLPQAEADAYGEQPLQLRERGRYEYRLCPATGAPADLTLLPQRGIQPSRVQSDGEDRGLIEPQDYCGLLPLTIVRRNDATQTPLAFGSVEVCSWKLEYREQYRGMLAFIADKCAGLLLDCRATTRLRLDTLWQKDERILEQQLEFLRYTLESTAFRAAIDEILRNPHRRLEAEREERDIHRPFKAGKELARQIVTAQRRVAVPPSHPFYPTVPSLPARVSVPSRRDFLDTPENRFVRSALVEFRDFLAEVATHLTRKQRDGITPDTQRLLLETARLRGFLETQLSRGFLPDVGIPTVLPLGSPVLQRKAGYRELLRFWLQFHAGAQLAWDAGSEIFHAGARNVATLYEYWLFFQLENLFRQKFACDQPLHAIIVDRNKVPPQLLLKRGVQLKTPVTGVWSTTAGRHLRAEFHFNRKFPRQQDHRKPGSWTRGVQPDYTFSIWPAEYTAQQAEELELMVHVHFDAKYRVERVEELLGEEADDASFASDKENKTESRSAAKYGDLLKMHAYRDAIRRTAGAYVLYPGNPQDGNKLYAGFHEILPGLGAMAVRPNQDGNATGMDAVAHFLDDVVEHLANRTTARERLTYHVAESYRLREEAVPYGQLHLAESDSYDAAYRALPPAEEMVLVGWYENAAQLALARDPNGFTYIRLGRRRGAFTVHPNLARTRYLLLRTHAPDVASGLLSLREPGFVVLTRTQLRQELQQHARGTGVAAWETTVARDDDEYVYALFKTQADPTFADQPWDSDRLMTEIEQFEADARNRPVVNLRRTSPYPRLLPLQSILKARR